MQTQNGDLTGYEILQVHPAAPLDLITAVYWRLAGRAQAERATSDPSASATLWTLTRAYEVLSRPPSRSAHDQHYGIPPQHLAPRVPSRRRGMRLLKRRELLENGDPNVDYYEILRVAPGAEQAVIEEAYSVLRNLYIRLVRVGSEPRDLIDCLEEAWAITSDAERRQRYDEARERRKGQVPKHTEPEGGKKVIPGRSSGAVPTAPGNGHATTLPASGPPGFEAEDSPLELVDGAVKSTTDVEQSAGRFKSARSNRETSPVRESTPAPASSGESPATTSRGGLFPATAATATGTTTPDRGAPPGAGIRRRLTGSASVLIRTVRQQWRTMSKREMEQVEAVAERRHPESPPDIDQEDALIQRLSSRSIVAQGAPGNEGGRAAVKLELVEGPGRGACYELGAFPLTLGGDEDCDIALPALAGQRARLLYRDGRFVVYKLAGAPGSEADPDSAPWWILESGDDLRLGPYTLRFTARVD